MDHRMIMVCGIWLMVLNVTFNNISVISWWPVLLVEETRVPGGKKHRSEARHWQTLSHNVVSSTPRHERDLNSQLTLVVIGTDCTGSCKSNYHMIMTTTAPHMIIHVHFRFNQIYGGGYLGFLLDTINTHSIKDHPRINPAKFAVKWFSSFR